ncbi:MAG: deoxyribonuclease IV [Deltaproteobacteria bacterium]|nr:deoxyribonuclease IV [Deltaproteobacteria bacterium]
MPIGFHASIAGGISKSIARATDIGTDSVQIFCRSPRSWKVTELPEAETLAFKKARKEAKLWPVVVHTSYLINLSTPDIVLFKKSLGLFITELKTSGDLGIDYLVTHPGSFHDKDPEFAIKQVTEAIKIARESAPNAKKTEILIENTAGGGSQIGATLEAIGKILKNTKAEKTGLCYDTCHGFAAGYATDTKENTEALVKKIKKEIGLKRLKLIHLNDSKGEFGSKRDRHEAVGEGFIGSKALGHFINHPSIKDVPLILETPRTSEADDIKNLKKARALRGIK